MQRKDSHRENHQEEHEKSNGTKPHNNHCRSAWHREPSGVDNYRWHPAGNHPQPQPPVNNVEGHCAVGAAALFHEQKAHFSTTFRALHYVFLQDLPETRRRRHWAPCGSRGRNCC